MRVFAGTMHTIENECDRCVEAIRRQKGCEVEHFIIENKPHQKAHQELYSTFMANANRFDLFVKVDADMVLCRDTFFQELAQQFETKFEIDNLTVAIHDYFPDRLVLGLHAWRSRVRWPADVDLVFADGNPVPRDRRMTDWERLAPAAVHCPDPSPFQAFHYGVIRGVKIVKCLETVQGSGMRLDLLEDTWRHYRRAGDRRLALACAGGELAIAGKFGASDLDHSCPKTLEMCRRLETLDAGTLARRVRGLRFWNRLRHPRLIRRPGAGAKP